MHLTKDIKVCIPPTTGKNIFHSSGLHHVIYVAILKSCWSLVNTVYYCPAFSVSDLTKCIVVRTVSGLAGFILISGRYLTCVAGQNPCPASLAVLVLYPFYFGISTTLPIKFMKWKSSLTLLIEGTVLPKTLNAKTSYLAASQGIGGFEGPLYRWTMISCLGSDKSSLLLFCLTSSRFRIGFSIVWCSCVIITAMLYVCFRPF